MPWIYIERVLLGELMDKHVRVSTTSDVRRKCWCPRILCSMWTPNDAHSHSHSSRHLRPSDDTCSRVCQSLRGWNSGHSKRTSHVCMIGGSCQGMYREHMTVEVHDVVGWWPYDLRKETVEVGAIVVWLTSEIRCGAWVLYPSECHGIYSRPIKGKEWAQECGTRLHVWHGCVNAPEWLSTLRPSHRVGTLIWW